MFIREEWFHQETGALSGSGAKSRPRGRWRATGGELSPSWESISPSPVSPSTIPLQVRKSSQEVLLALVEQGLISQCDMEGKVCPILLERSAPDCDDECRAEAVSVSLPGSGLQTCCLNSHKSWTLGSTVPWVRWPGLIQGSSTSSFEPVFRHAHSWSTRAGEVPAMWVLPTTDSNHCCSGSPFSQQSSSTWGFYPCFPQSQARNNSTDLMSSVNAKKVCKQWWIPDKWVWQHTGWSRAGRLSLCPAMLVFPVASCGIRLHILLVRGCTVAMASSSLVIWWWALLGSAVLAQCHSLALLLLLRDHHGPSHFLQALPCVGLCRWDCVLDPFWEFQFRAAGLVWPGWWMLDEQIVVFLFRKEWRYRKELFFFPKCKSIIHHVAKKLYCSIRTFGNYSSFI